MKSKFGMFLFVAVLAMAPVQRAHAIAGAITGNVPMIVVGGLLVAASVTTEIIIAQPGTTGRHPSLGMVLLGVMAVPVGLIAAIVLPDGSTAARFKSQPRDGDPRRNDYNRDLAKLNHVTERITERLHQAGPNISDAAAIEISKREWRDFFPTFRPGTQAFLREAVGAI